VKFLLLFCWRPSSLLFFLRRNDHRVLATPFSSTFLYFFVDGMLLPSLLLSGVLFVNYYDLSQFLALSLWSFFISTSIHLLSRLRVSPSIGFFFFMQSRTILLQPPEISRFSPRLLTADLGRRRFQPHKYSFLPTQLFLF